MHIHDADMGSHPQLKLCTSSWSSLSSQIEPNQSAPGSMRDTMSKNRMEKQLWKSPEVNLQPPHRFMCTWTHISTHKHTHTRISYTKDSCTPISVLSCVNLHSPFVHILNGIFILYRPECLLSLHGYKGETFFSPSTLMYVLLESLNLFFSHRKASETHSLCWKW